MFNFDDDFGLDDLIELDIQYGLFEEDYIDLAESNNPRERILRSIEEVQQEREKRKEHNKKRKTKHRDREMESIIKEIKKLQKETKKDTRKIIEKIFKNIFKSKHEGEYIDYEK